MTVLSKAVFLQTENISAFILFPPMKSRGALNKQVCLTFSAGLVPALGPAGRYWLQLAALRDRTSGLLCLRLKASLMREPQTQPSTGQEAAAHELESIEKRRCALLAPLIL